MARRIYAASPRSADMLYATGFHAPDAFLFLEHRGKKTIVLNDLEIDRGRREAEVDEIISASALGRDLGTLSPPVMAAGLLLGRKIRRVEVPADFPLGFARHLEKAGIKVAPVEGHFWPEREIKDKRELADLVRALGRGSARFEDRSRRFAQVERKNSQQRNRPRRGGCRGIARGRCSGRNDRGRRSPGLRSA